MRIHPALIAAPLLACGPKGELVRYSVDVTLTVPEALQPAQVPHHEVGPCTNAEIFETTMRVYEGYDPEAVTAIRFTWSGFDLSGGGENTETIFLREGETYAVPGAIDPSIQLYEIDHKGRMFQLDKDIAKVRSKETAEVTYSVGVGAGLPIEELHELSKEVDVVDFVEEGVQNCELTQF